MATLRLVCPTCKGQVIWESQGGKEIITCPSCGMKFECNIDPKLLNRKQSSKDKELMDLLGNIFKSNIKEDDLVLTNEGISLFRSLNEEHKTQAVEMMRGLRNLELKDNTSLK